MPHGTENLMYSFNMGPVHFIGFSTEVYYFLNYGLKTLVNHYAWLERDLIEANKPENRLVLVHQNIDKVFVILDFILIFFSS